MNQFVVYLISGAILLFVVFRVWGTRYQKRSLVLFSLLGIFCVSIPTFIVLLAAILLNYLVALQLSKNKSVWLYWFAIVCNVAFLFTPKLFHFSQNESMLIIVGVSFYCLQNISFLQSVYTTKQPPQSLVDYVFYISYFPKFISGPIENYSDFNSKLKQADNTDFQKGIGRICLGLLKKYVLAERIAHSLLMYSSFSGDLPGATELMSTVLYTLQLYFDFSAYIDIVIGVSLLIGIRLKENFDMPFRSLSISEFWQRWHISLMDWLRVYIYYPISFSLRSQAKLAIVLSVFAVFLLSAVWHGFGATFIIWGLIHALFILIESYTTRVRLGFNKMFGKLAKIGAVLYTFAVVVFANIFFSADSVSAAIQKIKGITQAPQFWIHNYLEQVVAPFEKNGMLEDKFNFAVTILCVLLFIFFEKRIQLLFADKKYAYISYGIAILMVLFFGQLMNTQEFMYAQF